MCFNANECRTTRLVWTDRLTASFEIDFEQEILVEEDYETGDDD